MVVSAPARLYPNVRDLPCMLGRIRAGVAIKEYCSPYRIAVRFPAVNVFLETDGSAAATVVLVFLAPSSAVGRMNLCSDSEP